MVRSKYLKKLRKANRSAAEIEEEQSRTLYIRFPKTIKNSDEIRNLLLGDFKIKLLRQSSRHCHVIFSDIKDKLKNLKALNSKEVDGKPIFAGPPKPINLEKRRTPKPKKIVIPPPKVEVPPGKFLFISEIAPGVKPAELKDAFPGSKSVVMMKGLKGGTKRAKIKMSSPDLCVYYVENKSDWPTLQGKKVTVKLSKKSKKNEMKKKNKSKPLQIYDGENEKEDKPSSSDKKIKDSHNEDASESDVEEDEEVDSEDNEEVEEEVNESESE